MKIAILTPGILPVPAVKGGAVENLIQEIISENQNDPSLDLTVFGLETPEARKEALNKFPHVHFQFYRGGRFSKVLDSLIYNFVKLSHVKVNIISFRYIFQRLSIIMKYVQSLKSSDFDKLILVTNSTLFLVFINPIIRKKYLSRSIFYLHNEVRSMFRLNFLLKHLHGVWGISQFVLNSFDLRFPEARSVPHWVIHNCIDTEYFMQVAPLDIETTRLKYGISAKDFVVLFSGRLVPEKGVRELLEACRRLSISDLKIVIVGGTFYSSDVKSAFLQEIHKLASSLPHEVIFAGYVPYNSMPVMYYIADIVCLPSIWDEPAGMTMLEAASIGKPLITTNSGGITEYLSSKYVYIVDRNDIVENINYEIEYIYKNIPKARKQASEYGKILRTKYSKDNYYKRFSQLITE